MFVANVLRLVVSLLVIWPAGAMCNAGTVSDDVVEFEHPSGMKRIKPRLLAKQVANLHTLTLQFVSKKARSPSVGDLRDKDSKRRVGTIIEMLRGYLRAERRRVLPPGLTETKYKKAIDPLRAFQEVMVRGHQALICSFYNRSYRDRRKTKSQKAEFSIRDSGYVCIFWPLKSKHFYLADITLSERFSVELGHEPIEDFQELATKIAGSVRFLSDKP